MQPVFANIAATQKSTTGWVEKLLHIAGGKNSGAALPAKGAVVAGIVLSLLQAADGILTSMGINRFGMSMEGNPLLRTVMEHFGHIPTLAVLKTIAIFVIFGLIFASAKIPWVKSALGAVSFVYFFAAILPWTYILFFKTTL